MADPYNKNRCAIFNYIIENPGGHFSKIMRELNLTKRGLGYHLEIMTMEGIITSKSKGIFKFYYPAGFEVQSKKLTPVQQEIFDTLQEGALTIEDLAEFTGRSRSAVSYHLNNLRKKGYVEWRRIDMCYEWYVE